MRLLANAPCLRCRWGTRACSRRSRPCSWRGRRGSCWQCPPWTRRCWRGCWTSGSSAKGSSPRARAGWHCGDGRRRAAGRRRRRRRATGPSRSPARGRRPETCARPWLRESRRRGRNVGGVGAEHSMAWGRVGRRQYMGGPVGPAALGIRPQGCIFSMHMYLHVHDAMPACATQEASVHTQSMAVLLLPCSPPVGSRARAADGRFLCRTCSVYMCSAACMARDGIGAGKAAAALAMTPRPGVAWNGM